MKCLDKVVLAQKYCSKKAFNMQRGRAREPEGYDFVCDARNPAHDKVSNLGCYSSLLYRSVAVISVARWQFQGWF